MNNEMTKCLARARLMVAAVLTLAFFSTTWGGIYELSQNAKSYTHTAVGGSSPKFNTYQVKVPAGKSVIVTYLENKGTLSKTAAKGKANWYKDGKSCAMPITLTSDAELSIKPSASPDVSSVYTPIAGFFGMGGVIYGAPIYHYFSSYSYTVEYTIIASYSGGTMPTPASTSYTVTYKPGAHGVGSQQTAKKIKGKTLVLKGAIFTRSGYEQTGWSESDGGSKKYGLGSSYSVDSAKTFFPYWTANAPKTFAVTYKPGLYGSGSQRSATKTKGKSLILADALFSRKGYTQTGWSMSETGTSKTYGLRSYYSEDAPKTLYPFWKADPPQTYAVEFNANGGAGVMSDQVVTVGSSCKLKLSTFSRANHRFLGWAMSASSASAMYADGAPVSFSVSGGSRIRLFAVWEEIKIPVVVSFSSPDAYGGSPESMSYYVGRKYGWFPFVWRTGYDFSGWYTSGGTLKTVDAVATANVTTLYARWNAHRYTVHFDSNGGSGRMADQVFVYDREQKLTTCAFSRSGYRFLGWLTSPLASAIDLIPDGSPMLNLCVADGEIRTFYACWEKNEPDLTVDAPVFVGATGWTRYGATKAAVVDTTIDQVVRFRVRNVGLGKAERSKSELHWSCFDDSAVLDGEMCRDGTVEIDVPAIEPGESVVLTYTIPANTVVHWGMSDWERDEPLSFVISVRVNTGVSELPERSTDGSSPAWVNNHSDSTWACFYDPEWEDWHFPSNVDAAIYGYGGEEPITNLVERIDRLSLESRLKFVTDPRKSLTYRLEIIPDFSGECSVGFIPNSFCRKMTSGKILLKRLFEDDTYELVMSFGANDKYLTWRKQDFTKGEVATFLIDYREVSLPIPQCEPFECMFFFDSIAAGGASSEGLETSRPASYEMTFDVGFGMTPLSRTYVVGLPFGNFPQPKRDGYSFRGWYHLSEEGYFRKVVESRVANSLMSELKALWSPNTYEVNYDANGGRTEKTGSVRTVGDSESGVVLDGGQCQRRGYVFAGWAESKTGEARYSDGDAVADLPDENGATIDMYAAWTPISYKVRFEAHDGKDSEAEQSFNYDEEKELRPNSFSRKGCAFLGWSWVEGGGVIFRDREIVKNLGSCEGEVVTLHAVWDEGVCALTFDPAGGVGEMPILVMKSDEDVVLPRCAFSRDGFSFVGWARESDETQVFADGATFGGVSCSEFGTVVLRAIWTSKCGTIQFNSNGGHGTMPTVTMAYDENRKLPSNMFVRDGRTFLGWSLVRNGQVDFSDGEMVSGLFSDARDGVTLYAVWNQMEGDGDFGAFELDGTVDLGMPATYDAFLWEKGTVAGCVQVKTAKGSRNSKRGVLVASVTATVTDAAGRKWSYSKGVVGEDGRVSGLVCSSSGAAVLDLTIHATGLSGSWGSCSVFGSRNEFSVRGSAASVALDAHFLRSWTVVLVGARGTSYFQLNVKAKGAVAVAGTLPDGTKVSAAVQLVLDEDGNGWIPICIPIKKFGGIRLLVRLDAMGVAAELIGECDWILSDGKNVIGEESFGLLKGGLTEPPEIMGYEPSVGNMVGVRFAGQVAINGLGYPAKFSAKGLPAGLKLDSTTGAITGVPTKAGAFSVSVTVAGSTNAKWPKAMVQFPIEIAPLPTWAQGTFTGWASDWRGENVVYGSATLTVGATGKISGKVAANGTNWTYSAVGYVLGRDAAEESGLFVAASAKAGKLTRPLYLKVEQGMAPDTASDLANASSLGEFGDGEVCLWRSVWNDKETKVIATAEGTRRKGVYTVQLSADGFRCGTGYLTVTVDEKGAAKAAGKLADGTSVSASSPLYFAFGDAPFAFFCAAPSGYKGGAAVLQHYPGMDEFDWGWWANFNPEATGDRDAGGYVADLYAVGGWYDKLENLHAYYDSMTFRIPTLPSLGYTHKSTVYNDIGSMVTKSCYGFASAVDMFGQDGNVVKVDENGKLVIADATKPILDKAAGIYMYEGTNDGALTLSFNQATGVFKGTYTLWYDYESGWDGIKSKGTVMHSSKKISFEGVVVPGLNMDGFFLWDSTGHYTDAGGRTKTYKYKESYPVSLEP